MITNSGARVGGGGDGGPHKDTHKSGGADAFASGDLLEAHVIRLKESGGTVLTLGAIADGQAVERSGTDLIGATAASGDVVGPAAAVDNAVCTFDSTTGKLIDDNHSGAVLISDAGTMTLTAAGVTMTLNPTGQSITFAGAVAPIPNVSVLPSTTTSGTPLDVVSGNSDGGASNKGGDLRFTAGSGEPGGDVIVTPGIATPAGDRGRVLFRIPGTGTDAVVLDMENRRIGFAAAGTGTFVPATEVHMQSESSQPIIRLDNYASGANNWTIEGRRARGTIASPAGLTDDDDIIEIAASGYDGTSFSGFRAQILIEAAGTWTGSSHGTRIVMRTTDEGSTTVRNVATFSAEGALIVGSSQTPVGAELLRVQGDALVEGDIEINGALNHDGTTAGLYGVTPVAQGAALTAEDSSVIDATYDATEQGVLNNVRTRVGEIESRLQALGAIA